jgi:putative transposase
MYKAFKYQIKPNKRQKEFLFRQFGACRFVYNWALNERTREWTESKTRVTGPELGKRLTQLKHDPDHAWMNDCVARCFFYTLRDVEDAYTRFFRKQGGYPAFKKRRENTGSATFDDAMFKLRDRKLFLSKLMDVPLWVNWNRPLPCAPKRVTVSVTPDGRWWVSFLCDVAEEKLPVAKKTVGIDLGITAFATLSNGEKVLAPKVDMTRVKKAQRSLARKTKGSANYRKAKVKLARAHARVANTRTDFLHKLSRRLVDENQVIVVEDLAVKNMVKNRCLARSISEQGWSEFTRQLAYKSEWAGRLFVKVDRWFPSSKTCSDCGHVVDKLPLNIRSWECPSCHACHDRDHNAAKNILAAGKAVTACGVDGRPMPGNPAGAFDCEAGRPVGDL